MAKSNKKHQKKTQENDGEMYSRWFFEELVEYGYLKRFDREVETLNVLPAKKHKREKHFVKKKNTEETFTLLNELNYTYDFRLIWNEKAIHIFTDVYEKNGVFKYGQPHFISQWIVVNGVKELVSYVDIKPHSAVAAYGGNLSTFYTFPLIQKILMITRDLFINKMIPVNSGRHGVNTCMFAQTFTPNRYRFTDGGGQLRSSIRFSVKTITSFAEQRKGIIDKLKKEESLKNTQQTLL